MLALDVGALAGGGSEALKILVKGIDEGLVAKRLCDEDAALPRRIR
jgi:hypothetical protein